MCNFCDNESVYLNCVNGAGLCEECYDNDAIGCAVCGGSLHRDDCKYDDHNDAYCDDCYDAEVYVCDDCGANLHRDYMTVRASGRTLCEECNRYGDASAIDGMGSNDSESGMTWSEYAECAELVKELDFGCRVDCNGCSVGARCGWNTERSCCAHCAFQVGYLRNVPVESVETVKALFDEENGFWSPNGCRLPHGLRSVTCLSYFCGCAESADRQVLPLVAKMLHGDVEAKKTIESVVSNKMAFAV